MPIYLFGRPGHLVPHSVWTLAAPAPSYNQVPLPVFSPPPVAAPPLVWCLCAFHTLNFFCAWHGRILHDLRLTTTISRYSPQLSPCAIFNCVPLNYFCTGFRLNLRTSTRFFYVVKCKFRMTRWFFLSWGVDFRMACWFFENVLLEKFDFNKKKLIWIRKNDTNKTKLC